jgi:hypothetical protein
MIGTVPSFLPMCSLYRIVVLPAGSSPSITTCMRRRETIDDHGWWSDSQRNALKAHSHLLNPKESNSPKLGENVFISISEHQGLRALNSFM